VITPPIPLNERTGQENSNNHNPSNIIRHIIVYIAGFHNVVENKNKITYEGL
jgi:hypothetical protein